MTIRLALLLCIGISLLVEGPCPRLRAAENATPDEPVEPWLQQRLEWFQDLKFGFMMHWAPYSQWGCIESWPLIEEDKWARPDDLKVWTERGKDMEMFKRDYWVLPKTGATHGFGAKPDVPEELTGLRM